MWSLISMRAAFISTGVTPSMVWHSVWAFSLNASYLLYPVNSNKIVLILCRFDEIVNSQLPLDRNQRNAMNILVVLVFSSTVDPNNENDSSFYIRRTWFNQIELNLLSKIRIITENWLNLTWLDPGLYQVPDRHHKLAYHWYHLNWN